MWSLLQREFSNAPIKIEVKHLNVAGVIGLGAVPLNFNVKYDVYSDELHLF